MLSILALLLTYCQDWTYNLQMNIPYRTNTYNHYARYPTWQSAEIKLNAFTLLWITMIMYDFLPELILWFFFFYLEKKSCFLQSLAWCFWSTCICCCSIGFKDGISLIKEPAKILERWHEHFTDVFHNPSTVDTETLWNLSQCEIIMRIDQLPHIGKI